MELSRPQNGKELLVYYTQNNSEGKSLNELACQFDISEALVLEPEQENLYVFPQIETNVYYLAGKYGAFRCLEKLLKKKIPDKHYAYFGAAGAGKLCVMRFLEKRNIRPRSFTYDFALRGGHTYVANWLARKNCRKSSSIYHSRAREGDLKGMKWLVKNDFKKPSDVYPYAIESGNISLLNWMYQEKFPITKNKLKDPYVSAIVYHSRSIPLLNWLLSHSFPKSDRAFWYAMNDKYLTIAPESRFTRKIEVLQFLHMHQFPLSDGIICCVIASISSENPDSISEAILLIEWLLVHGLEKEEEVNSEAYRCAIEKKNIPMMDWLYENGFAPSLDGFIYGAISGDLQILEWLKSHNFNKHPEAYYFAIKKQFLHVLEWLYENEFPVTNSVTNFICRCGTSDEIKQWLCDHGIPITIMGLQQQSPDFL